MPDRREDIGSRARSLRKGKSPEKPIRKALRNASAFASAEASGTTANRSVLRGQMRPPDASVEVMEVESPRSQLELLQALSQLDQRRTIVSVRLTEGEFACLRDRAEESGISVSAYMRSCVVDADQLRAQVKRALAEMRSLSAVDAESRTALTKSGPRLGDTSAWNSQGWFRLVLRPLAFLFGPLFPARRSA